MYEISKSDWKLFREKVGDWQERHMEKLCEKYVRLLKSDKLPSEKFWALEKRIKQDKRNKGVLIELRKSETLFDVVDFLKQKTITMEDLADFSDDFKETVQYIIDLSQERN